MSETKHNFESETYVRVEFHLERGHGTFSIHEVDCNTALLISGLKDDLSHLFGLPAEHQQWMFNNDLLEDGKTLLYYGENTGLLSASKPRINVKRI